MLSKPIVSTFLGGTIFTSIQYGLVCAIVVFLAHRLLQFWRRRQYMCAHGCEPIVEYPKSRFWKRNHYAKRQQKSVDDGRFNAFRAETFQECGSSTFVQTTLDERSIHSMEPLNHQVLVTKMDDWIKEPRPATRAFVGDNIVLQNGPAWKHSRSLVDPLFKRAELNDTQHFRLFVDRMISLIPRDGSIIDMQPLIRKLYVDSSTDFIFGRSIDTLRDTSGKSDDFLKAYDRATIGAGNRARPTGVLSHLHFTMTRDDEWLADCKTVYTFVDDCIAQHRNPTQSIPKTQGRYILMDGMSKAFSDPIELRFQLMSIFSLARETPSALATNTLFLLARNPSVWKELRKVALALGSKDKMTFDELMKLSLFRYTVLETIRLHSPIVLIRRMAARDTVLPRGGGADGSSPAFVPKGRMVFIHKYPAWRDSQYWGDDVEAFRPSRFENRSLGWEFSPFSSGPRNCPANRQVISQVIYLLYRLTLEFDSIENRDPCLRFVEGLMMCVYSRNGCQVSLKLEPTI